MEEGDGDPSGRKNPEDDTTNTWHHHYQVSQDQMRATKRLQLIAYERIKANRERLWTATSKR